MKKRHFLAFLLCLSTLISLVVPALAVGITDPGYQEPVAPEITVNYYNGTELLVTQYLKPGDALVYPDAPTRAGGYFVGWGYDESTAADPQPVTLPADYAQDVLNLYAVFVPYPSVTLTVNFLDTDTGMPVSQPVKLKLPEDLLETDVLPTELPTVYGYALDTSMLTKDTESENVYYINAGNDLIKIEYKTEDGVTTPSLRYDFTNLATAEESELTFNLFYKIGEANYTVEHWVENADDSDYTLAASDILSGRINTWTNAAARTDFGEGIVLREDVAQTQIASDGSSVVKIYYERRYYMITFDANGGVDAPNPIYDKYGATVGSVTPPTRAGYTFKGWSPALPANIPAENLELVAQWALKAPVATAKVIIWGENANDTGYSLLNSYSVMGTVGSTVYMNSSGTLYAGSGRAYVCGLPSHTHRYAGTYEEGFIFKTTYYYGGCFPGSNGSGGLKQDELTDANAICGKVAHTHSASCYTYSNALYTFRSSESKQILADGTTVINVYYDRNRYTWTFKYSGKTRKITAKWGEYVYDQFMTISRDAGRTYWTTSGSTNITLILTHMSAENRTYTVDTSYRTNSKFRYWLQKIDAPQTKNSTNYTNAYTCDAQTGANVAVTAFITIEGFTCASTELNGNRITSSGVDIYYTRNSYRLIFNNGSKDVKTFTVPYDKKLSSYGSFTPEKPNTVDSDYIFEGWYYNAECTRKVNLSTDKMPAGNLILYANWVPPTYVVNSFKVEVFSNENLIKSEKVEKNDFATEPSVVYGKDYNPGYEFVGWFYLSDGVEIPFSFKMPITQDYQVYAKWRSTITAEYSIRHINDDDGSILKEHSASAPVGRSVNGYAEFGMKDSEGNLVYLIAGEKTSKSITLTEDGENVIEFHYSKAFSANYLVEAKDKDGNDLIAPDSQQSLYSVTTIYAPYIRGYTPTEAYKIISLTGTEEADAVFTYTQNEPKAYTAQYWFEPLEGGAYLHDSEKDADYTAPLGSMIYMDNERNLSFEGFKVNYTASSWRGIAGRDTVLNLKYDRRRDCAYTVHYYLQGTTKKLAEDKVVSNAVYGESITENAVEIPGYAVYGASTASFTVGVVNGDIVFYYEESVTIRYEAVVLNGSGLTASVDPAQENFGKASGVPGGSRAVYDETVIFVGWFDNAAGDGEPLATTDRFIPTADAEGNYSDTYYAVFKPNFFTLIVEKPVNAYGQSALFTVSWTENGVAHSLQFIMDAGDTRQTIEKISRSAAVTVTQNDSWTWRYDVAFKSVSNEASITAATENSVMFNPTAAEHVVSFTDSVANTRWIAGDLYRSILMR